MGVQEVQEVQKAPSCTPFLHLLHFLHLTKDKKEKPMRRRKLPPGTRHHEPWCAIFYGKACNCDDDDRPKPRRPRPPLSGGDVPKREPVLEEG
jgi:hypothetical protein